MSTVGFITRDLSGTTRQSTFSEGSPSLLNVTHSKDISLNLSASDIDSYVRRGSDLHLVLADGQILVLQNYYSGGTPGGKNLFLSEEGNFVEVILEDKAEGALFASYEPLDISGKWSAYDDMVFLDVDRIEPVIAPLAAAPLLGGAGAATAAGVAGVAAVVGGGGGGGGGGGSSVILPTVDNPDAVHPVAGATTDPVVITGTGTPGAEVEVNVGGETKTGIVKDDGTWEVSFDVSDLPPDGNYDTTVKVKDPDGTNHDLDGPSVVIDTTPPDLDVTSGTQSTGDIVNGAEHSSGTVISGTGEAGASVSVVVNGHTQTTTVANDGSWSVTFGSGQINTGEYSTGVSITTTDSFGNSASFTETLVVDTVAPPIAVNTVETDNVINKVEASDGVTLSGTGEAGSSISVVFQGITQTTTVAANGTWSVGYSAGQITSGTYDTTAEVTSTDQAGNSSTSSHSVRIDTEAAVTLNSGYAGADDTVNAAERAAGLTLTGTSEPGSSVQVFFGAGAGQNATVDAAGNWTVNIPAGLIPTGTTDVDVEVHATDVAGNTDVATHSVAVDTEVTPFTANPNQTANDVVNQDELNAGFALQGTVEPGSSVIVTIQGIAKTATVDAAGNWSAEFSAADLPAGEYTTSATIVAQDAAGNTSTLVESFEVDTVFEAPVLDSVTYEIGSQDVSEITVEGVAGPGESITVNALEGDGSVSTPGAFVTPGHSDTEFDFNSAIPDGTDLVVTNVDALGNGSSTLLVLEDNATTASTLNHAGLSQFNIDELDLGAASNVSLVLTEADIKALSENSDTLTIHSGNTPGDDSVTVTGATHTGTRSVGGESYNVYTVGNDGTTLVIDQDVTVII